MKFKRITAFALAFVMLGTLPELSAFSVGVHAATNEDIKLSFIKGDDGGTSSATILTDGSTVMKVTKSEKYVEAKKAFTASTIKENDVSDKVEISRKEEHSLWDIKVADGFKPDGGFETLKIKGNFYALRAEGDVHENAVDGSNNQISTVESTSESAITELSECTIECTKAETETDFPEFAFKGLPTGSFADYKDGKIYVKDSSKNPKELKTVTFQMAKGNKVAEFKIHPKQVYIIYDTSIPGKPVEKSRNNFIRKGTTFELVFRLPVSNELFFRVRTPQNAVDTIAKEIMTNDGINTKSYIELDAADSMNFITKSFKLKSFTRQFNANFDIKWEWIPTKTGADEDNVVVISSSGSPWRNVTLFPKEEDVSGTLKATVTYTRDNVVKATTVAENIGITIRGTGKPAVVTQFAETIGTGNEVQFDDPHKTLPSQKEMDVYNGIVTNFDPPKFPYSYKLMLSMGQKNASSQYAIITADKGGSTDALSLNTVINGSSTPYTLGDKIGNPMVSAPAQTGAVTLSMVAKKPGTTVLNIKFYVKGNDEKIVEAQVQPDPIRITVIDTSPKNDASLQKLSIRSISEPTTEILKDFTPGTFNYDISVPYKTDHITWTLETTNGSLANRKIGAEVYYRDANNVKVPVEPFQKPKDFLENGYQSLVMNLEPNQPVTANFTVTAQNPNVKQNYTVNITRLPPSNDATLKAISAYFEDDLALKNNLVKNFNPLTKMYVLEVPFRTQLLRIRTETSHYGATVTYDPPLEKKGVFGANEWYNLKTATPDKDDVRTLTIKVKPEDQQIKDTNNYELKVQRLPPSEDATLKDLKVTDKDEKALSFKPGFKATTMEYQLEIPYATDKIKIQATPNYPYIGAMQVWDGDKKVADLLPGALSTDIPVRFASTTYPMHKLEIRVVAEASFDPGKPDEPQGKFVKKYILNVVRSSPSSDDLLKMLTIKDQDNVAVKNFSFSRETHSYALTVPYETTKISFTPTASQEGALITVRNDLSPEILAQKVPSGMQSPLFPLLYDATGTQTTFKIVVTAEDSQEAVPADQRQNHKKTYEVRVTRSAPSDDARLKGLTTTGTNPLTPLFISNKYDYAATVTTGAKGITITATTNHPGATITIGGDHATSAQASELIELIEITQEIPIVVTAQDGKTIKTYKIKFRNDNLIEKSNNADLKKLTVNYGQMTPSFKSSITSYEVAATEKTYSVDIIPRPADSLATMQVFAGSKEIGDQNGNFSQAIADGENEFVVKVTSSDKSKTKEYDLKVYRNEEDKMNNLTPLQPDDIDFKKSDDVILVSIGEYPRVSAEVFNELKKYPEKSIIFQGNDYSIQFNAADLKRVIPQETVYDFRMTFTSPDEEEIIDEIDSHGGNDDLINRAVMIYFEGHGDLPAPATFHLSLGRKYRSTDLYWHYFNKERERIDYYGRVKTNTSGTFAVQLDHLSSYIITPRHRILGSEMKNGVNDAPLDYINDDADRINPNTGAAGGSR